MRTAICLGMGFLVAFVAGAADPLVGQRIEVKAGDQVSENVPISLSLDGFETSKPVQVKEVDTGKVLPTSLHDGVLTFVSEGATPGTEQVYVVEDRADAQAPPVVRIEEDGETALKVFINDVHFTTYHYSNENKKPFLWPVLSEGGVPVTRAWPMGEEEDEIDHPHHKSMWSAYGDLNGADMWGEGGNSGYQVSDTVAFDSGDAYGWIRAANTWTDGEKEPVLKENREYRFYATPDDGRLFDLTITFTALEEDVEWRDTKEGGIFAFRIRDQIRADRNGTMVNSEGQVGEKELWGKPAAWLDYYGPIEDAGVRGIAVFDNADNLRHPTRWHARNYGLVGANCFGLSYFTKGKEDLNGDYTLKAGESITFKYRCYIHSGDTEKANVADRYADYATPPAATWAE